MPVEASSKAVTKPALAGVAAAEWCGGCWVDGVGVQRGRGVAAGCWSCARTSRSATSAAAKRASSSVSSMTSSASVPGESAPRQCGDGASGSQGGSEGAAADGAVAAGGGDGAASDSPSSESIRPACRRAAATVSECPSSSGAGDGADAVATAASGDCCATG